MKKFIYMLLFLLPVSVYAASMKTNINGVVIKKPRCSSSGDYMWLIVSNRSSNSIKAILIVTSFDAEKDPIGNAKKTISLGPISGNEYGMRINCTKSSTYAYRFQQTN